MGAFQPCMFCQNIFSWTATAIKKSLHSLGIPDALFWPPSSDSKVWSLPPLWESSLEVFYICLIRKAYLAIGSFQAEAVPSSNHLTFHLGTEITFFHLLLFHLGTEITLLLGAPSSTNLMSYTGERRSWGPWAKAQWTPFLVQFPLESVSWMQIPVL